MVESRTDTPFVLRNVHVFDTESGTFGPLVDVRCKDGRFERITASGDTSLEGATVVEGEGKYLLPGLIDCHVHLTSSGDPDALTRSRAESPHTRALRAAQHARATLEAGFTTVRDLGAPEGLVIDIASAVDSGLIAGPTIIAAGMGITMTGGHGHGFIAVEADGEDAVRKAVREQLRAGAKAIKLFASGGVMTPGVDPRSPSLTEREMASAVEEAHKAFRPIGAHAQATEGIKNAIRAGVDSIEHGVWLDDEAIALMVERGTWLVPTLTAPHHIAHGGLEAGIAPYMVEKGWQVLNDHLESYRKALKAGVRIAMGTDQGTPLSRPGDNAQEISRMAEHGMSASRAILAATCEAARLLRIADRKGKIAPGFDADAVLVRANPLEDITILEERENIAAVLKQGVLVVDRMTNGGNG